MRCFYRRKYSVLARAPIPKILYTKLILAIAVPGTTIEG
jgi:hypothetical protein